MKFSSFYISRNQGFSLIELMVAITLGLLIMTALITLFLDMSRTNREMAKTNAQIENGRFAIQLLQNDIVHGGFWGGYVPEFDDLTASTTVAPGGIPSTVPDPCSPAAADADGLIALPLQTYEASTSVTCVIDKKDNTDIALIRHAATSEATDCTGTNLCFQASNCADDSSRYKLATSGFDLREITCTNPTAIRKLVSNIYWIRNDNTLMRAEFTGAAYDVQPLIDGIEGFRIELGRDYISDDNTDIITGRNPPVTGTVNASLQYTKAIKWADEDNRTSPVNRGDGIPDEYIRCPASGCTVDQLINVVSVKVYILARASQATAGYKDTKTYSLGTAQTMCSTDSTDTSCDLKVLDPSFKRHVFSTTVRLNNISGRRETP